MTWQDILKTDFEKGWKDYIPKFGGKKLVDRGLKFADEKAYNFYMQNKNPQLYNELLRGSAGKKFHSYNDVYQAFKKLNPQKTQVPPKQTITVKYPEPQAQQARQQYVSATRRQTEDNTPHESVWRRPAY